MRDTQQFHLLGRLRGSQFFSIFNRGDELSRGRISLLIYSLASNIASVLFSGTFYSGFLLANGIDLVQIGVISFIPNLCVLFSLLSPPVLAKMAKRKWFLIGLRFAYYFFLIIGITVLPYLNLSKDAMIWLLALFLFIAHGCNAFSNAGWFVWHKKLLPDNLRTSYFSYSLALIGVVNSVIQVLAALLADALKSSGSELTGMVVVRLSALIFAAIDLICLSRIKEYPYEATTGRTRMRDVFLLPFKHKRYLWTMVLRMAWSLVFSITSSFTSVFLLQSVGISYTYIYIMTALYGVFLILCTPIWKKIILRFNMFRAFAFSLICIAPAYFLHALLTPDNYLWLYPLMMALLHWSNVGVNLSVADMPYINMPHDHEECFASFYAVVVNIMAFVGLMIGTACVGLIGDATLVVCGQSFGAIPLLLVASAVLFLIYAIASYWAASRLMPEQE